jgi:hypothetical protein
MSAVPATGASVKRDSVAHDSVTAASDSTRSREARRARHLNWFVFFAGGFTSLGLHETGHIVASFAVGAHPSFGFTVQTVLDEAILDIPHPRGSTFERGILFGGLATTAFYITLGRNGSVSDVEYMARTSSLSKWGVSAIYGGIAATQVLRMSFMGAYAHFFAEPLPPEGRAKYGAFNIGVRLTPSA